MNSMIKKIVAVMAAVVMAVTAAVSVSADYATVDLFGFFCNLSNSTTIQINVGDTVQSGYLYSSRWCVNGLMPDYTYDLFMDLNFSDNINTGSIYPSYGTFYSEYGTAIGANISGTGNIINGWKKIDDYNCRIEVLSEKHIRVHLYYNYNISGLKLSTIQLATFFNGVFGNVKLVSSGVGAYYDPGGDTYSQLIYEYGAGNPLPDVKDIKDQGNAMSSAEAAVRDKSSDLISSVDSEWTGYQTDAKALATTLQPAATQINNLYATITAELPDEVKALFIAIPILLFIGWLIGRVRE